MQNYNEQKSNNNEKYTTYKYIKKKGHVKLLKFQRFLIMPLLLYIK